MGVLDDLIAKEFGVKTRHYINREIAEVGTTALKVARADNDRLAFLIINMSANKMYLAPEVTPSSEQGIILAANGGYYGALWSEELHLVGYQWNIVAADASSDLFTFEVVGYKSEKG